MDKLLGWYQIWVSLPAWAWILIAVALVAAAAVLLARALKRKKRAAGAAQSAAPADRAVRSVTVGKLHEQGAREGQQDCFAVSDGKLAQTHGVLAIVADGMGGLADGDKVSAAAVKTILDGFTLSQNVKSTKALLLALARQAVEQVNALLGPENYRKSGSTLVLGLVRDGYFTFLSIGDSRVSLYRDGVLMQLNREHTYENDLSVRAVNGGLSVDEALGDPKGAGLVSFLGMGEIKAVDMPASPLRLFAGDKVVLMSDGVYNALSEEEITAALAGAPAEAAESLRAAIRAKGYSNQDNYTAVIIGCGSGEE